MFVGGTAVLGLAGSVQDSYQCLKIWKGWLSQSNAKYGGVEWSACII
jgi:hypothetical protein